MTHKRAEHHQTHDQHAERQRQHVIGIVRVGGDVQEEDEVDAHLGDGEHQQCATAARVHRRRSVPPTQNEAAVSATAMASPMT